MYTTYLITVAAIMGFCWILTAIMKAIKPDVDQTKLYQRLMPLLPIVAGICSPLIPWLNVDPPVVNGEPVNKYLIGMILGTAAGQTWKVFKEFDFGMVILNVFKGWLGKLSGNKTPDSGNT